MLKVPAQCVLGLPPGEMGVVCMGLDVTALYRACGTSFRFCCFLSSGDATTWGPEKAKVCLRGDGIPAWS